MGGDATIHGGYKTVVAACTASAATSEQIDKKGYAMGCVFNESGGSVTITYYAITPGGAAIAAIDKDATAITQTVADDRCAELPPALAGFPTIIPVVASGTPSLTFHFER